MPRTCRPTMAGVVVIAVDASPAAETAFDCKYKPTSASDFTYCFLRPHANRTLPVTSNLVRDR